MTQSATPKEEVLPESSVPAGDVSPAPIVRTEELRHSPSRPSEYEKENSARAARELERTTEELLATNEELQREIAERKAAEERLRRSEAFLAEAQRLSSIGSFSWRVATNEITWSDELYRIYELEIGKRVTFGLIRTRVHPDDISLIERMRMVAEGRASSTGNGFEWQYRLLMPDGRIKYMHAVAHATRDQDGQLEYIAAVQDVTARRLSEEALDKARSALARAARAMSLGALTASIAHEVNQPLSGVITNASTCLRMLDSEGPNVEGARETARRAIRDGYRASEVITRLRELFGRKEARTEAVNLNEATREVIALTSSQLKGNRVVLQTEFAEDLPSIVGDRVQLQQVILNLLLNASDAMSGVEGRPRRLLIRTTRGEGDSVSLTVQDSGVGFDREGADKLFEAFYTTKDEGMGIGLSVSRSIIESHHGHLRAAMNDGPGASFSFSIPCESQAQNPSLVSVVDDDESVRESLPDLLRQSGFAVQAYASAEEFLASGHAADTRCLILDIAMLGMSGPDLQRELVRRRQSIPIIFITAHRDESVRRRLLEQGAVDCLFKPLSDTALREALDAAIQGSRGPSFARPGAYGQPSMDSRS